MLNLALVRLPEVIGEAATRVSDEFKTTHTGVEWRPIVAFRNRVIHGYDSIDFDVVWSIVADDLPRLQAELEAIVVGQGR